MKLSSIISSTSSCTVASAATAFFADAFATTLAVALAGFEAVFAVGIFESNSEG
jgi:hypothetical protein